MNQPPRFAVWRHPRAQEVDGRCIGRTDVAVDNRKAKRLAHRIRHWARRHGAARIVLTSGLRRSAAVGRWLAAWGWRHRVDACLAELDFGRWDGLTWEQIGAAPVAAWCEDFAAQAPGGAESVADLLDRCGAFVHEPCATAPLCIVGHAGWISAAQWLQRDKQRAPSAAEWPVAVAYASLVLLA